MNTPNTEPQQSEKPTLQSRSDRAMNALKKAQEMTAQKTPQAVVVEQPRQTIEPPQVIETKIPEGELSDYNINPQVTTTANPPQESQPKVEEQPQHQDDEVDSIIDPKGTTAENFKKLRTKLKSLNTRTKELETELQTKSERLQEFETGSIVPEEHKKLLERVSQLEPYEKLYNLKASPAYVESFTKPLDQEISKLREIGQEYGADERILKAALDAKTRPEQNAILARYFDEVGALEVKAIISNIKNIQSKAAEAEKEPEKALATLHDSNKAIVEERKARSREAIGNVSKDAWVDSLVGLRTENMFPEISFREGDTEHNDKIAKPILTKASIEYGKLINALANHGLETLPKDIASALARMVTLAHVSAIASNDRNNLRVELANIQNRITHRNTINRPGINGVNTTASTRQVSTSSNQGTLHAEDRTPGGVKAARRTLEKVLATKK